MNKDNVLKGWISHVMFGTTWKGRYSGSAFWSRGNVIYQHEKPGARIEQTVTGDWFALETYQWWGAIVDLRVPADAPYPQRLMPYMRLPSIGVATDLPGDVLRGDDLHAHMYRQFSMMLDQQLEAARTEPITRIIGWRERAIVDQVKNVYQNCQTYRENFKRDLPLLPNVHAELEHILSSRKGAYNDPKAVAKRERAAARKIAKEALGVTETSDITEA